MDFVKKIIEFVMDILETVVFIGSIFIVVYLFILQPNKVQGASMEPNFQNNDFILTSKITYRFRGPERGDVIVFKAPSNPDIDYIKRIIGLPGDTVTIQNGQVYVNGSLIDESFTSAATNVWDGGFSKEDVPFKVPDDELFVMGDNRPRSSDSREFGPIPIASVIGQVFYRYFPASDAGWIKNPFPSSLRSELVGYFFEQFA